MNDETLKDRELQPDDISIQLKNNDIEALANPQHKLGVFKKRTRTIRFVLVLILLTLVVTLLNGSLLSSVSKILIVNHMNSKYDAKFEFVQWIPDDPFDSAIVRRIGDDKKEIRANIIWDNTYWDDMRFKVIDDYYDRVVFEYSTKYLNTQIVSSQASKVFKRSDVYSSTIDTYESWYTIDQVKQGPSAAPNMYNQINLTIYLFGKPEKKEAMIKEVYESYIRFSRDFKLSSGGSANISLAVFDDKTINSPEWINEIKSKHIPNKTAIYIEEVSAYLKKNKNMERLWYFENDGQMDVLRNSLKNYDYFRFYNAKVDMITNELMNNNSN